MQVSNDSNIGEETYIQACFKCLLGKLYGLIVITQLQHMTRLS